MKGRHDFQRLRAKSSRRILGLMSGTSADGVTAALTEISGTGTTAKIRLTAYGTYPYPEEVSRRLFNLFTPGASTVRDVCEMNFVVGECFADAALRLLEDHGLSPEDVDAVGSHGQTVWHQPKAEPVAGIDAASTLQIGEPAVISMRTGLPVVADFRKADMAAGGQGAPLTPYLDYVLNKHPSKRIVLQNIGGIANLTYIPASASPGDVVAFDTGPGNMIIDAVARHYTGASHDVDGGLARSGVVHQELLTELLGHPYYSKRPPKTTGREMFGEQYAAEVMRRGEVMGLSPGDVAATITALTAETIADAYTRHLSGAVDEVYVSGGGLRNPALMDELRDRLNIHVRDYSELGFPGDAKESVLVALLANEHIMGTPCNLPSATGARQQVVLGSLAWV
ncbi:MAG: anhydro-N-acetylmuramic acid kinase [Candidatus Bathyarchaeota archaeon]